MKISEAFERYRSDQIVFANLSSKTEEHYVYTCKSLLTYLSHDLPLSDLTFELIRKWKLSLERKGLSPRTVRGYILNFRVVLKYMQRLGYECLDPHLIITPKRIDRPPNYLTAQEVAGLLTIIQATPKVSRRNKVRNAAIVSLLYGSGLRIAELCSLNREDVKDNSFSVFGKGQKTRPCFLDERTRQLLDEYLTLRGDANSALFVDGTSASRLKVGTIQALFRRLTKRGGFKKPVHAHTLRHSYATNLLKNGCHIYTLSRLMGHTSIATTQIYLHHHDAELAEAHQRFHTV